MRLDLLGTGSADRWPNPWCGCDRCQWARDARVHRGRTSALLDGSLLIDPGPDAGAGGHDLTGVRTVLITHDHPDHLDPAFLLAWSWASGPALVVAGPSEAIERCRQWVGPDAPVEFRALVAGDVLAVDGPAGPLRVRALPAAHSTRGGHEHDGTALLFEVTSGDAALLYATDTAALPHVHLDGPYDVVLLELTFGDTTDHRSAHLDLPSFGHEVTRLRTDGRLAPDARVIAVHLSHHNPTDLAQRLSAIGAEVVRDGTALQVGPTGRRAGRRLLVTGGARSGKSHRAESVVRGRAPVTYVATAPTYPDDQEWVERIAGHRRRRPPGWRVRETAQVADILRDADLQETVLVDCLTLWVTAAVDRADAWEDGPRAEAAVDELLAELLEALATTQADVVLVTNEVGSGIAPATASGRLFRDLLGRVNAAVGSACDDVEIVTSGIPRTLKGRTWTSST
jgi:adenosylcobinamide kinase / adenosylcobinamide-phosphate guanylyltransferase